MEREEREEPVARFDLESAADLALLADAELALGSLRGARNSLAGSMAIGPFRLGVEVPYTPEVCLILRQLDWCII